MSRRHGLTLIEVLMATVILGTVLIGMMQALSNCLAALALSRRIEALQSVLGLGEIAHPLVIEKDPVRELEVSPDSSLRDGFTFSRECIDDESENNLYTVTTRVIYGAGGPGNELVVVRYLHAEL